MIVDFQCGQVQGWDQDRGEEQYDNKSQINSNFQAKILNSEY